MNLKAGSGSWTIEECTDDDITMLRCALNWAALYLGGAGMSQDHLKELYKAIGGRNWTDEE